MKRFPLLIILLFSGLWVHGQVTLKNLVSKPHGSPQPLQNVSGIPVMQENARTKETFHPNTLCSVQSSHEAISSQHLTSSGSFWIDLHENDLWSSRADLTGLIAEILPKAFDPSGLSSEWKEVSNETDDKASTHIRIQQNLAGYPIHGQDMVLHIRDGQLRDLNGFAWTWQTPEIIPEPKPVTDAISTAEFYLKEKGVRFQETPSLAGLTFPEDEATLVWFPLEGKLMLTYELDIHPNMMDHWMLYVDAVSLQVIKAYSQLCSFFPKQLYDFPTNDETHINQTIDESHTHMSPNPPPLDGPTAVSDTDLLGQNRTVNAYQVGTNFFMIDASRTSMFNANQSVMPNEPNGVIWTVDGQNGSPQHPNFEVIHVANNTNNWKNLEVSAHYNAGTAFEYFNQTYNRISINGNGGNIISLINIADENGNDMDNAFWNGTAMFYGNGDQAFNFPLARGLDVAGHEMSHGVIQNTANLEYVGQSGALNESFADVFGAMIDRNDWLMGEDVTNSSIFPTGAIRDLANPNNGGNSPGDPGWQPKHMNEFQNLPETPQGDNGGVHVNSGIPNRAFTILANNIGKEKAEQIYYKALRDYLVKSSQFIDMRNAAEKAASDNHGAGSTEVSAVRNAFDAVGIGAGQGGDYQDDIETNPGADYIIAMDEDQTALYVIPPINPDQYVELDVPAPWSRPSFTDDGRFCVYTDQENNLILVEFNWAAGLEYEAFYLDQQGIWNNIVISKDGNRIAFTTIDLTNEIFVYDLIDQVQESFQLSNPTSAQGLSTGDVLYPDAMEWDYTGENIMYDALNRIETNFGDGIEYWDISFLNAWDNETGDFGLGQVSKLFSALPENVSVGNPSFAKNSPYIITFDFLEIIRDQFGQEEADFRILAANLEEGIVNEIFENNVAGFPSYSGLDHKILFTVEDAGSLALATIDVQPDDKTLPVEGTGAFFVTGAQKGVWFQTGERIFTATNEIDPAQQVSVWPQPATDFIKLGLSNDAEYKITDLSGKIMSSGITQPGQDLDISDILPGIYFISLLAEDQLYKTKFVKQ